MRDGLDTSQLEDFNQDIIRLAGQQLPKERDKFLKKEATELRKNTARRAKMVVDKKTGNYFKGIKKGKVYTYGAERAIRVYGGAPHTHLIEKGHRMVVNGREVGYVRGYGVFEQVGREFEEKFYRDCEQFVDDILEEGLKL